jgi:Mrp family chromosome partitioning ATPase
MTARATPNPNILKLRNEVAQKIVDVLIQSIPPGTTEEDATEIHHGVIWRFVFATMVTSMDARAIRATVDNAIREAIPAAAAMRPEKSH